MILKSGITFVAGALTFAQCGCKSAGHSSFPSTQSVVLASVRADFGNHQRTSPCLAPLTNIFQITPDIAKIDSQIEADLLRNTHLILQFERDAFDKFEKKVDQLKSHFDDQLLIVEKTHPSSSVKVREEFVKACDEGRARFRHEVFAELETYITQLEENVEKFKSQRLHYLAQAREMQLDLLEKWLKSCLDKPASELQLTAEVEKVQKVFVQTKQSLEMVYSTMPKGTENLLNEILMQLGDLVNDAKLK